MRRRDFFLTPGAAALAGAAPTPPAPRNTEQAPERWRANWIWTYPEPRAVFKTVNGAQSRNAWFYVRKTFTLAAAPTKVLARVCADSRYLLFVNGVRIGFGPSRSDPRRQSYDVYTKEIAAALRPGKNVVAALVHHIGEGTFAYILGRAGFLCEMDIEAGGKRVEIQTDSSWKLTPGLAWQWVPYRMSLQTDFPEIYDARYELTDWNTVDFDDSLWSAPVLIGPPPVSPWGEMAPREIPFFAEREIGGAKVIERGRSTAMEQEWVVETDEIFGRPEWIKQNKLSPKVEVSFDVQADKPAELIIGTIGPFDVEVNGRTFHRDANRGGGSSGHLIRRRIPALPAASTRVTIRFDMNGSIRNLYVTHAGKWDAVRYSNWRGRGGVLTLQGPIEVTRNRQTEIAAIQHTERFTPSVKGEAEFTRIDAGQDTYVILDFGREVFGHPQIKIRSAKPGAIIDMGYSEHLEDGRPVPNKSGVNYADRYITREGAQQWETFEKRAFRYMQLDFRNLTAPVEIESVGLRFSTYPVADKGWFECEDKRLNRIWDVGRYTVQLNMDDAYTDCPWRERAMWMGDARVEGLIGFYAFNDRALLARTLRLIGESQDGEGLTRGLYPSPIDFRLPSFTLLWVLAIWDYYVHSADAAFVRELYPRVKRALEFFERKANANGLLEDLQKNYWVFIDWTPIDNQGEATAFNCLWVGATDIAVKMAELLNDGAGAARFRKVAARTRGAIRSRLWLADKKVFADCRTAAGLSKKISQPTNAFAVVFGVAPEGTERGIMEWVLDPANKAIPVGSPYFSFYLLQAMYQTGMHERALAYIREQWGAMMDAGATTWWETWNGTASWCHGWSAGPTYDLMAEFAGIKPTSPGFRKIAIQPNPCGINDAKVRVPTPAGDVRFEWSLGGGEFKAELNAPSGIPIALSLPRGAAKWSTLVIDGKPVQARLTAARAEYDLATGGKHSIALRK